MQFHREPFTDDEVQILQRFFTNVDLPVFALINLPEVVKGALFARYSRSSKSIRRLFLDEFATDAALAPGVDRPAADDALVDLQRAEKLYDRVFTEYGDDSVAQLGGTHLACEQASNILTKVLEWGRLASYLEQSTRYIYYDTKLDGRYRYVTPPEIAGSDLEASHVDYTDMMFDTYSRVVRDMTEYFRTRFPQTSADTPGVYQATIRAKACDAARGLLPASTRSNVGIYASGQAYEMALIRMQAHPLEEVRVYGDLMLTELRKVIPSFLTRVDRPDRGGLAAGHLAATRRGLMGLVPDLDGAQTNGWSVELTDWDPDGERKLAAAAVYAVSEIPDAQLQSWAAQLPADRVAAIVRAMSGDRTNRRHRPGRAMERITYRFDVTCDFGAFRDLQRHRLMTIEWQPLTTRIGYDTPDDVVEAGFGDVWCEAMDRAAEITEETRRSLGIDVAQYTVPFAFHIRFVMQMNARQAFHVIELRSQPAGHPTYRRVVHEMHRQIADVAGHQAVAQSLAFVDHTSVDLERLDAERRAEARRAART